MNNALWQGPLVALAFAGCGAVLEESPVEAGASAPLAQTAESALGRATGGVYASFDVGGEPFAIWVTNATGVKQVIQMWQGRQPNRHPSGKLVCTSPSSSATAANDATEYNAPWSWHVDGATVTFASTSIELCDGRPSFVEASPCAAFANGTYCPWSAKLIGLRDCRTSSELPPNCPPMPH